jgi:hypothetical protein
MIVDDEGERSTPKQLAQDIVLDAIAGKVGFWEEYADVRVDKLTERERQAINDQIKKQFERVQTLFNQSGWRIG